MGQQAIRGATLEFYKYDVGITIDRGLGCGLLFTEEIIATEAIKHSTRIGIACLALTLN